MKCRYCGSELPEGARECPDCGKPVERRRKKPDTTAVRAKVGSIAGSLNSRVSEARQEIRLRDMYVEIFKKHSRREAEELFICGTESTTPGERRMIAEWPRPWVHSRVFAVLLLMTLLLLALNRMLNNLYAVPSLLFVGSLLIPFSLTIFFWECNIPRNISFIECLVTFFLGGVAVLILDAAVENLLSLGALKSAFVYNLLIALVQVLPLILVICVFTKIQRPRYILNGICAGSCVGGGFAMLLFVGRLFCYDLNFDSGMLYLDMLFVRHFITNILISMCVLNCGAMIGGGLLDAMDEKPLRPAVLKDVRFLWPTGAAFVLLTAFYVFTFVWDLLLLRLIVIAASVAVVLFQIAAGQRQCVRICHSAWDREAADEDEEEED